jgi:hypothetical protein
VQSSFAALNVNIISIRYDYKALFLALTQNKLFRTGLIFFPDIWLFQSEGTGPPIGKTSEMFCPIAMLQLVKTL